MNTREFGQNIQEGLDGFHQNKVGGRNSMGDEGVASGFKWGRKEDLFGRLFSYCSSICFRVFLDGRDACGWLKAKDS